MQLSILICDDLAEERAALIRRVRDFAARRGVQIRMEAVDSSEMLLARFRPGIWDVVLLDIYMPGLSGVDAARILRAQDPDGIIIFTTSSAEHGMVSHEVQASDYLGKPVTQSALDGALDWCLQERQERFRVLRVRSEWEEREVLLRDIRCVEIKRHTAHIYTPEQVLQTTRSIAFIEEEIASTDFLRCHRSFLVNLRHVSRMDKRDFILTDGMRVPIGSTCASEVRQRFLDWVFLEQWKDENQLEKIGVL